MIFTLKKCPDEPGEWKQGSTECLPWRVMQGLQRNVIGMALCYAALLTPGSALTSFDLATRPHRTDIKVRFHVVLPEG
nr:MAG TPA: hypothetical protein [Caudoviricetes sp.]